MKLVLLTTTALVFFCSMIDAVFINCEVHIVRETSIPYTHDLRKNMDDSWGDCFDSFYKSSIEFKKFCTFKNPEVRIHPEYSQAIIALTAVCKDGAVTRTILDRLNGRGFNRI